MRNIFNITENRTRVSKKENPRLAKKMKGEEEKLNNTKNLKKKKLVRFHFYYIVKK